MVTNNTQFIGLAKPKKAFSLMKYKKRLHKDTSLMFDEKPTQAILPKDAFDFCKVEDVKDCQELLKHVSSMHSDDVGGN